MNRHGCVRMMGALWSIVVMLNPQAIRAQADSQQGVMELICLTDRPAIIEGDSTRLRAWPATPGGTQIAQPVSFAWEVTEGTVQGSGPDVQWDLSRVRIQSSEGHKKVMASVKAMATGRGDSSCLVEVFIGRPTEAGPNDPATRTRGVLRAARQYLLPNTREEEGFGLYSYLLLPDQPGSEEEKARYLKTLESCLRMMESVEDHLRHHRDKNELNATHIPVKRIPTYSPVLAEWAANVLAAYDYTAAQALLDKLDKTYQRGPYLVSVLKDPLSVRPVPVPNRLLQDFTGKVPALVSEVVELFIYRAAQQRIWTDVALRSFTLNMRNLIAVAGKVSPEVVNTMITLVQANRSR